jgi:predicted phosphatase
MANPAKAKGTAWETATVNFVKEHHNPEAHRNVQMGAKDIGDFDGYYLHASECKNVKTVTLPEFIRQANREAANAGKPYGCVWLKRRQVGVKDSFVIRDAATDVRVINRLRDAECLLAVLAPDAYQAHLARHA